jgi:hypothetical protein
VGDGIDSLDGLVEGVGRANVLDDAVLDRLALELLLDVLALIVARPMLAEHAVSEGTNAAHAPWRPSGRSS